LVAATGAAVGAVMVGPAAGPLEQPPSANNANISPTASARTGALLLILITIVRIIGFMMLAPYSAPRLMMISITHLPVIPILIEKLWNRPAAPRNWANAVEKLRKKQIELKQRAAIARAASGDIQAEAHAGGLN
jgi:hypothetical protein